MNSPGDQLLRAAVASSESEARAAWRKVRESMEIDSLAWDLMQIIPVLQGRFDGWLRGDPSEGILQGLIRRAWSEAQIRLGLARNLVESLEQTGCTPVVLLGSAAVSLANGRAGSVRPIPDLRILIARQHLPDAARALAADRWQPHSAIPTGDALNWREWISFSRDNVPLYLFWRPLHVSARGAAAVEREFLRHLQTIDANGARWTLPAPEHLLLLAIAGRIERDPDVVPWQVDAALLAAGQIDWKKWPALAGRYAPQAFARLNDLRALGMELPDVRRPVLQPILNAIRERLQ